MVVIIGPSGGGKSTCASLIPRFWDVSSGRVLVGGVDVRDMDPHELMDQVASCFRPTSCSDKHLPTTCALQAWSH